MKRVLSAYIFFGALLLGVGGCAVTDVDRTANFSQYKTFAWGEADVQVKNPAYKSDLINKNIKATVQKEFAKRGISLDSRNPDFLVSYHTYTEKKEQQTGGRYYGYPFYPFRYYPFGWRWGMPYGWGGAPQVYTYTEGTLIIDITDRKTDELVWRGTVSGNVNNIADLQKQIAKGIRAIMKKYPVTPQEPLMLEKDIS